MKDGVNTSHGWRWGHYYRAAKPNGRRHPLRHPVAGFTLVEIMIVVAIIAMLAALTIPSFMRARKRTQATYTLEDAKLIDAAKGQFALENRKPGTFIPKVADIRPYLRTGSRLYNNTQLSNFRDIFGRAILMGDLNTPPLIDDATRDYFSDIIPSSTNFWGPYCR